MKFKVKKNSLSMSLNIVRFCCYATRNSSYSTFYFYAMDDIYKWVAYSALNFWIVLVIWRAVIVLVLTILLG